MLRRGHERGIHLPLFTIENMVPKVVRMAHVSLVAARRLL
jgi:hypothetical protein